MKSIRKSSWYLFFIIGLEVKGWNSFYSLLSIVRDQILLKKTKKKMVIGGEVNRWRLKR